MWRSSTNSTWHNNSYSYFLINCKLKPILQKKGEQTNIYVSWSTSELRVRITHCETGLSPPVKYFYWPCQGGTSFVGHLCYSCFVFVSWSTSELRVMFARCETGLSPPLNIFYITFQGCTSFVDHLCYFCLFLCFRVRLFIDLWCLILKLSLSHWYPGSGVVLGCIDSWSLSFFLLSLILLKYLMLILGQIKDAYVCRVISNIKMFLAPNITVNKVI